MLEPMYLVILQIIGLWIFAIWTADHYENRIRNIENEIRIQNQEGDTNK